MTKKYKTIEVDDPDYGVVYHFITDHGKLETLMLDFDEVQRLQSAWDEEHPKPEPPLIPVTPQTITIKLAREAEKLSKSRDIPYDEAERIVCANADKVANHDDEDYKKRLNQWKFVRHVVAERYMLENGVVFTVGEYRGTISQLTNIHDIKSEYSKTETYGIILNIMKEDLRWDLYRHFTKISVLTYDLVKEEAEKLRIKRNGQPILEMVPDDNGEPQPIESLGLLSALENNISPSEFKKWPIRKQASFVAAKIVQKWMAYFAQQDARKEAELKRRNNL